MSTGGITPEQDALISEQAAEGMRRLAVLILTDLFNPSADLRAAIAELNGAVAWADRCRPTPPPPTVAVA